MEFCVILGGYDKGFYGTYDWVCLNLNLKEMISNWGIFNKVYH